MSIVVGSWEDKRSKNHCAAVVGVDGCTHQTAFIEGTVDAEFVQLGAEETGLRASLSVTYVWGKSGGSGPPSITVSALRVWANDKIQLYRGLHESCGMLETTRRASMANELRRS